MQESKYPISVNGKQCISPCYFAYTPTHHPVTLEEITYDDNFCHVDKFVYTDNGKTKVSIIDKCNFPTTNNTNMLTDIDLIFPRIHFDSEYFLKIYYKLLSLEDVLSWLDANSNTPFKTRERVFDTCLVAYGKDMSVVDHRLVKFIDELLTKSLKKIYMHLRQYITINKDAVSLGTSGTPSKETSKLATAYIKKVMLGTNNINQFLVKLFKQYNNKLNEMNCTDIVNHFIAYATKKIQATI